ncbi:hypothetical protein PK28_04105 [Hymenobacter sp. DG25B]|nr:hypothetical protein PK28_04105 [Hymenobacter sp. DG25B]
MGEGSIRHRCGTEVGEKSGNRRYHAAFEIEEQAPGAGMVLYYVVEQQQRGTCLPPRRGGGCEQVNQAVRVRNEDGAGQQRAGLRRPHLQHLSQATGF